MNFKFKKVLKIISNALVILVVVFAFLLHGTRLIGLTPYSVLSGSMQSVYPTGSLIYVKEIDTAVLEVGDIITYRMTGGSLCTHRIVELVPDDEDPDAVLYRTKGDENETADGTPVAEDAVIGKAVFGIPLLGYIATYIAVSPGKYIAFAAAIALVLAEIIIGIVLDDKDEKKSKPAQD